MPRASAKTLPTHHRDPRAHGLVRLVRGCRTTRGTDRIAKRSAPLQYLTVGRLTEKLRLRALLRERFGNLLAVIDAIGGDTQRERAYSGNRGLASCAVGHHSRHGLN